MKRYRAEDYIADGDSIGIFFSAERHDEPLHSHDFIEVIYIVSGEAEHSIDGEIYKVERGDVLFINYGCLHSFSSKDGFSHYNICFSPETVGSSMITPENAPAMLSLTAFNELRRDRSCGRIGFYGSERGEIEQLLSNMERESREGLPYSKKLIESYMSVLMTKLLRKTVMGNDVSEGGIWEELREYIDANLDGELTLSALASKSFYNPSYFSRAFKQKFGTPFTEYVTKKRLGLALELLERDDIPLERIAERCGFPDRSAFYHAFLKYMGASPSEYRKRTALKK